MEKRDGFRPASGGLFSSAPRPAIVDHPNALGQDPSSAVNIKSASYDEVPG